MGKILAKLRELQGTTGKFPFQNLPDVCKLKVFSYLGLIDKGLAAQVCHEWNQWLRSPSLWTDIDLTRLPLHSKRLRFHRCSSECYEEYRVRISKFLRYLAGIRPMIRRVSFAYDIADYKEGWFDLIELLFMAVRFGELEAANLNWKATSIKPLWSESFKWSVEEPQGTEYIERRRQRLFAKFFEMFVCAAPKLKKLIMPFDWSTRSINSLITLENIETLTLEKYFAFQALDQVMLDAILQSLRCLRQLIMEIWTPSGNGLIGYQIRSESLEFLDVSQCRGFCISRVCLENIRVFKASRRTWKGPLALKGDLSVPCLYQVLSEGAPRLEQLNDHILQPHWREHCYDELDVVLRSVCSCSIHR